MKAIINSDSKIIERIIQNKNGEFFRAWFLVCEREGKIFAKLIRVQPLAKRIENRESRIEKRVYFLPVKLAESIQNTKYFILNTFLSPYILNTFFMSQMTRAPSF